MLYEKTMTYYLTAERFEDLKKELENLKTVKRQEIADRLKRAKEFGDLSENSEYSEAREEQSEVEARIYELEEMIKHAAIIKKGGHATGVVHVGSTIKVKKGTKEVTYTIVGSDESSPEENKISNESPLGRAFLGKKAGEIAEVETPSGKIDFKIVSVD